MPARSTARRAGPRAAALAAAVLLAYAPVLGNGLVWDDVPHIADNPRLRTVGGAASYLVGSEGSYYRPLVFVAYAVEHAVWGAAPLGYHLTNLLLHAGNTTMVGALARQTGASPGAAFLGAAMFALHPVQTEAVAYVSGRTDLLMTAGALLSWTALLGRGPLLARGLGAAAAGALAMLSKESGYALVLLWPWLAWRHGGGARARLFLTGPGILTALLLLALRPGGLPWDGVAFDPRRLAGVGEAVLGYAAVLVWPASLQVDRLTSIPDTAWGVATGLLALVAALALAGRGLTRRPPVAEWTAWTCAFYLPVANLLALYPAIADRALFTPEHNLYAPLAGLAVLAGSAAERIQSLLPARRRGVARVACAALLTLWAVATARRCATWRDDERLFGTAVTADSASPRVWYNYGNALLERGDARAAEVLAGAARRAPRDAAIWTNLGVAYQRQGSFDAAERAYRRAAELAPRDAQVYENLGTLYLARGDLAAARAAFESAVRLDAGRDRARRALQAINPTGEH